MRRETPLWSPVILIAILIAIAILIFWFWCGGALQADRSVRNQRRRFHVTLELGWSADKTVQQLGRTHRANQTQPPTYVILSSSISAERRFAAAVAKRLMQLGALTQARGRPSPAGAQAANLGLDLDLDPCPGLESRAAPRRRAPQGDRRAASGSNVLAQKNVLNRMGSKALKALYGALLGDVPPTAPTFIADEFADTPPEQARRFGSGIGDPGSGNRIRIRTRAASPAPPLPPTTAERPRGRQAKPAREAAMRAFLLSAREALESVGLLEPPAPPRAEGAPAQGGRLRAAFSKEDKKATGGVERLLNRLLGVRVEMQSKIFDYFEALLEAEVVKSKRDGSHCDGIVTARFESVTLARGFPRTLLAGGLGAGSDTLYHRFRTDRGVSWAKALSAYHSHVDGGGQGGSGGSGGGGRGPDEWSGFYVSRESDFYGELRVMAAFARDQQARRGEGIVSNLHPRRFESRGC